MFSGCNVPSDSNKTQLGSSDEEASPSAGKNTRVILVPYSCMEVRNYSYFRRCGYFGGPLVSFVMADELPVRVTKSHFKDWYLMKSQPIFLFLSYLNLVNYGGHIIKSM